MQHISVSVDGMSCSNCESKVKEALLRLNGVQSVVVDLKLKKVSVEYDDEKVFLDVIKGTIEDQGYDVK